MIFLKIFDLGRPRLRKRHPSTQKRHEPRAHTHNVLKVTAINGSGKGHLSNLIDISESGIQFISRHAVEVGHLLEIVMNLPQKKIEVPVTAKVRWVRKKQSSHSGYRVGAVFTDINPLDKTRIREFVLEAHARRHKNAFQSSSQERNPSERGDIRKKYNWPVPLRYLKNIALFLFGRLLG